jgi:hypothetical protein
MPAARLKCDKQDQAEPLALPQLKAMLADRHDIDMEIAEIAPEGLTASTRVAFLNVSPSTKLSDLQARAIREWTEDGGMLWIDAVAGSSEAIANEDSIVHQLGLSARDLATLGDTPLLSGVGLEGGYRMTTSTMSRPSPSGSSGRTVPRGKFVGNRPVVLVVQGDLASGLAGINDCGIVGLTPKAARQLVANSFLRLRTAPPATSPATRSAKTPTTRPIPEPVTKP